MFSYNSIENILFSKGNIELKDKKQNIFKFTEVYIDEKKKKVIGSDAKIFSMIRVSKKIREMTLEFLQIVFQ